MCFSLCGLVCLYFVGYLGRGGVIYISFNPSDWSMYSTRDGMAVWP